MEAARAADRSVCNHIDSASKKAICANGSSSVLTVLLISVSMDSQEPAYAGLLQRLSNNSNSNEARLKLLERRLTGELPSPRSLTFDGQDLRQSDLDDVCSRLPGTPVSGHASRNQNTLLRSDAQLSSKKKRKAFSDQQDQQDHRSLPFQQVTNRGQMTSPTARRSPHRKSPALTSPLSTRLLQRNTINKYFPNNRSDDIADGTVSVSICTQTETSFQEQEHKLQDHLLNAFRKTGEAQ